MTTRSQLVKSTITQSTVVTDSDHETTTRRHDRQSDSPQQVDMFERVNRIQQNIDQLYQISKRIELAVNRIVHPTQHLKITDINNKHDYGATLDDRVCQIDQQIQQLTDKLKPQTNTITTNTSNWYK